MLKRDALICGPSAQNAAEPSLKLTPECGERYFHAKVLDEIDRLLKTEHDVKDLINVEVVSL